NEIRPSRFQRASADGHALMGRGAQAGEARAGENWRHRGLGLPGAFLPRAGHRPSKTHATAAILLVSSARLFGERQDFLFLFCSQSARGQVFLWTAVSNQGTITSNLFAGLLTGSLPCLRSTRSGISFVACAPARKTRRRNWCSTTNPTFAVPCA